MSKTAEEILKKHMGETRYNLDGQVTKSQIFGAMNAYADQRVSEARNEAIQEAIDVVNNFHFTSRKEFVMKLESLKVSTT